MKKKKQENKGLRENINLTRWLEIVTQELVFDHNNLVNLTMNLNDRLEQIFTYLDNISNEKIHLILNYLINNYFLVFKIIFL